MQPEMSKCILFSSNIQYMLLLFSSFYMFYTKILKFRKEFSNMHFSSLILDITVRNSIDHLQFIDGLPYFVHFYQNSTKLVSKSRSKYKLLNKQVKYLVFSQQSKKYKFSNITLTTFLPLFFKLFVIHLINAINCDKHYNLNI